MTVKPRYPLYRICFALLLLAAIGVRCRSLGVSLCTGEAWVVNWVLTGGLREMFYYRDWLQTTPPLFLLLLRLSVLVFGAAEFSFRILPLAFSIASVILFASLCRRIFDAPFRLFSTALVAFSPVAVGYAKEAKQYSAEMFTTTVILLLLWRYLEQPDRRRYAWTLLGFAILTPLSYSAIVFVPLAVVVILAAPGNAGALARERLIRCAGIAVLAAAAAGLTYLVFVAPNRAPQLTEFWKPGYPPHDGFAAVVSYYARNFLGLAVYFFVGSRQKVAFNLVPVSWRVVILLGAFAFLALLVAHFRRSRKHFAAMVFAMLPVVTLAALNLGYVYPAGSRRLTLFLLPCVALGHTLALHAAWERLVAPALPKPLQVRILAAACAFVTILAFPAAVWGHWDHQQGEDAEGALRHVRSRVSPADTVYIHASLAESSKFYLRRYSLAGARIVHGRNGGPCCTWVSELIGPHPELMAAEADELRDRMGTGALWLIFASREDQWEYLQRNDAEEMVRCLRRLGCPSEKSGDFENVLVYQVSCGTRIRSASQLPGGL